jgi:hypothetical protein
MDASRSSYQLVVMDIRLQAPRIWFFGYKCLRLECGEPAIEYLYQERGIERCKWSIMDWSE